MSFVATMRERFASIVPLLNNPRCVPRRKNVDDGVRSLPRSVARQAELRQLRGANYTRLMAPSRARYTPGNRPFYSFYRALPQLLLDLYLLLPVSPSPSFIPPGRHPLLLLALHTRSAASPSALPPSALDSRTTQHYALRHDVCWPARRRGQRLCLPRRPAHAPAPPLRREARRRLRHRVLRLPERPHDRVRDGLFRRRLRRGRPRSVLRRHLVRLGQVLPACEWAGGEKYARRAG